MEKAEEQNNVETPFILKGGVEKTVAKRVKKEKQELTDMEEKISGLQNVAEEMHNYVEELIADNKAEIAYLKTRQREEELEIKNRQENVKRLQEQRKAIRREERERQKLNNALKSDNIGLTKIDVATNKTSNYHPLENKVEPLIKSKQNQLVNQDEKNRLKNEYRASLFYPDDTEETKLYLATQKQIAEEQKREQKAQLEKQIEARKY